MKKGFKTLFALLGVSLLAGCTGKEIYDKNDYFGAQGVYRELNTRLAIKTRELAFSGTYSFVDVYEYPTYSRNTTIFASYEMDFANLKGHIDFTYHNIIDDQDDPTNSDDYIEEFDVYYVYDYKLGLRIYTMDSLGFFYSSVSNVKLLDDLSNFNFQSSLYNTIEEPVFEDIVRSYMYYYMTDLVSYEIFVGAANDFSHSNEDNMISYNEPECSNRTGEFKYNVDTANYDISVDGDVKFDYNNPEVDGPVGKFEFIMKNEIKSGMCESLTSVCEDTYQRYVTYTSPEDNTKSETHHSKTTTKVNNKIGDGSFIEPDYTKAIAE